jgi:hypothetical protein
VKTRELLLLGLLLLSALYNLKLRRALTEATDTLEAQAKIVASQDAAMTTLAKQHRWELHDEFEKRMTLERVDRMLLNGVLSRLPLDERAFSFELKDYEFCSEWSYDFDFDKGNRLGNISTFQRKTNWLSGLTIK